MFMRILLVVKKGLFSEKGLIERVTSKGFLLEILALALWHTPL